jgi:hypothetical protein
MVDDVNNSFECMQSDIKPRIATRRKRKIRTNFRNINETYDSTGLILALEVFGSLNETVYRCPISLIKKLLIRCIECKSCFAIQIKYIIYSIF